ncbi:hypothetical protein [Dyella psychrodurans]|uniref:Uncharacterized protein n=1 Tax=Dyella psychrodurans TaxID=1927960 RepID=A0A370XBQ6_9GAMM|nr:hypothetical protein [Dyella psychrodurans]RDS85838.1 hypothetical protein DWU99_00760 [Dyella psychrodurans]
MTTLTDALTAFVDEADDWQATARAMSVLLTGPHEQWIDPVLFDRVGWDLHIALEGTPRSERIGALRATPRGRAVLHALDRELAQGHWTTWPPVMRLGGPERLRADLAA